MRLLIISMAFPLPLNTGGKVRLFNLIKHLSKNHSITLLSFIDSEEEKKYIPEMMKYCKAIEVVKLQRGTLPSIFRIIRNLPAFFMGVPFIVLNKKNPEMRLKLNRLLQTQEFDIVQFEWIQMSQYITDLHYKIHEKSILVEHEAAYIPLKRRVNITSNILKSFWWLDYKSMKKYESEMMEKFSRIIVMSQVDKAALSSLCDNNEKIDIIPNGVDIDYYQNTDNQIKKENNKIVFVGWMGFDQNIDAVSFFIREIFPLIVLKVPMIRFYIVGKGAPKSLINLASKYKNITFTGFVNDIRYYISSATISVIPLRIGGGTRLKILESMASGTAVVSTSIGCEGIEANHGEHILIADEPEEFARKVVNLITNKYERESIEKNALKLVKKKYDWKLISDQFEKIYINIFSKKN